jgi:hypothetical protein
VARAAHSRSSRSSAPRQEASRSAPPASASRPSAVPTKRHSSPMARLQRAKRCCKRSSQRRRIQTDQSQNPRRAMMPISSVFLAGLVVPR